MTKQSICIPSRVYRDIYHVGIGDVCQRKNFQIIYENSYLVIGFKQIARFIDEHQHDRFKNRAIIQSAIFQAISKKGNCELLCHVLLCKSCYVYFDEVLHRFVSFYDYDDAEELYEKVTDKCLHMDLFYMFSRVKCCSDVESWVNAKEYTDYTETLVD